MDELVRHCLQALAFDGDLGCNVSRLRDFVSEYHSSRASMRQNLDDAYYAFVWSIVAQHPSVRVGVLPDGQITDVYIPPQPRVSKRDKAGKDDVQKDDSDPPAATLNLIPNASHYSLDELVQLYGDRLRIAVDSETCFVALTGSHARPAKLSAWVYASLQIIARSRESGISILDLSRMTGYDSKACFYVVKTLADFDLVVKLRQGGNSQNFCVHKFFFERSATWIKIRGEDIRTDGESAKNLRNGGEAIGMVAEWPGLPQFGPIDYRHLSSLDILRSRLSKLLSHSPDCIQPYTNISARIGYQPRSKTDRRFFITRLNELIREGTIEKFYMPSLNPDTTQNRQLFLRLAPPSSTQRPHVAGSAEEIAVDDEMMDNLVTEDGIDHGHVKSTITLQRQIVELLRDSSSTGVTLNELSSRLGSYDKKTLDLITSRLEHPPPPRHLADLSVTSVEERHGRERRNRYFILGGYLRIVASEGIQQPSSLYNSGDLMEAGGFMEVRPSDFYDTSDAFQAFYGKWSGVRARGFSAPSNEKGGKAPKKSRGGKANSVPAPEAVQKKRTNPILPDGTRKRGRPRKNPEGAEGRPKKRARNISEGVVSNEVAISGKTIAAHATGFVDTERKSDKVMPANARPELEAPKRKRGRPPGKKKKDARSMIESANNANDSTFENTAQQALHSTDSLSIQRSQAIDDRVLPIADSHTPSDDNGALPIMNDAFGNGVPYNSVSLGANLAELATPSFLGDATVTCSPVPLEPAPAPYTMPQAMLPIEPDDEMTCATSSNQMNESFPLQFPVLSAEGNVVASTTVDTVVPEGTSESVEKGGSNSDRGADIMQPSLPEQAPGNASTTNERGPDDGSSATSPSKTRRPGRRDPKTNLSALRRENELVQLIENAGGIVNTSTSEFLTNHMEHVEAIVRAGEATSTPVGIRVDRRTLNYAMDKMEKDGRIKLITTNVPNIAGGYRSGRIAYLPAISQEKLRSWLYMQGVRETASHAVDGSTGDQDSPLGLAKQWLYSKDSREALQERWHRNSLRAKELFVHSDDVVREAMLMEKQTLSQLYGYLTGKIMRARELHIHTIEQLERKIESPFVMSLDERIISISFFENDITLAAHCACIPAGAFVADIKSAVESEGGRDRLIKNVPDEWKQILQVGKAKTRQRILDLLDFLHSLRLATPLRQVEHTSGSTTVSFEAMPPDWQSRVPLIWPEYWQFCTTAPVHLFALNMVPAPFWKNVPTSSRSDAENYWAELKASCLDKVYAKEVLQQLAETSLASGAYSGEMRVTKALRRTASWTANYTLSWYQCEYLNRFVNKTNGNTPLVDLDGEKSRLRIICSTIHAPLEVVQSYFQSSCEMLLRELERKQRRETELDLEKQKADMKLLLAQKKVEAVRNREAAWDAMVVKVHPGLVKGVAEGRLRKLKQSYVRGNVVQDTHQWELQIQDAIKAAEKMRSSRKLFPNVSHAVRGPIIHYHPGTDFSQLPAAAQGKSVESLINMQENENLTTEGGGREDSGASKSKKARARKGKGKEVTRRKRFHWNADYDELARDAYAILHSRCRTHYRLEWGAINQVFPSVSPNSVRSRLSVLRDQPGAAKYLERLENCWHELWVKKRGTPELPDPNPRNPTEFDLKAHVQYLRKYLDKNAIRVGVSTFDETDYAALLEEPSDLTSIWDLDEQRPEQPDWDFLFNATMAEENRDRLLLEGSFTLETGSFLDEKPQSDIAYLAESALKIVAGAPEETYNANDAAGMLYEVGKVEIESAIESLLLRNVFSKRVKAPSKGSPGRTVKISEMNQNALGGQIAKDLFSDAVQLEESYEMATDEWREWPLTSTDGDTAALLQLFSDHQVEFDVDTSRARAGRAIMEGNSRKVDDDDIELSLRVRISHGNPQIGHQSTPLGDENSVVVNDVAEGHGESVSGKQACCGIRSGGAVDCVKCIEDAQALINDWPEDDRRIADSILQLADSREQQGIKVEELNALLNTRDETVVGVIHRLHTLREPLIYLTGYNSTVIVSAKYVARWALTLPGENMPTTRVMPRRWLDLTGSRVRMVWEAGIRAVVGLIHLRPGISQAEMRWRLKAVYDRQEVLNLLNHLLSSGTLKVFYRRAWSSDKTICIDVLSKEEEKTALWAVREDRRWYHTS